jgi:hypothetical protein
LFRYRIRPQLDGDTQTQDQGQSGGSGLEAPDLDPVLSAATNSSGAGGSGATAGSGSGGGAGGGPGSGGGGTQTVSTPGSGLVFVNTYAAGDTQQFISAAVAAEQALESRFITPMTINVTFLRSHFETRIQSKADGEA